MLPSTFTVTLLAHHIEWDTDGDDKALHGLPRKMEVAVELVNVESFACINQQICDQLSEATGYLVSDYQLEGYDPEAAHALEMKQMWAIDL
jgi:hypothetical protein